MTMVVNPYDQHREPKRWNVAQLLLSGETVSWDDLRAVAGLRLSPRTFGFILRDLESQGATILKTRTKEYGTLYRFDPAVPFSDNFRLSDPTGVDAQRNPPRVVDAAQAAVSADDEAPVPPPPDHDEEPPEALPEPLMAESPTPDHEEVTIEEPPSAPAADEPERDERGVIDITDDLDLDGIDITTLFGE